MKKKLTKKQKQERFKKILKYVLVLGIGIIAGYMILKSLKSDCTCSDDAITDDNLAGKGGTSTDDTSNDNDSNNNESSFQNDDHIININVASNGCGC
ncbi:hypothetical protein [Joostella sp.]|uniref:hypothetical protein n=1 Tax=Joostella sp. TaxID=2231138 RepID=UPI003A91F9D4